MRFSGVQILVRSAALFMVTAWSGPVFAAVVINEVQIDPLADRFIELKNTGSEDIDLTEWYLQRKTATGSTFNSLISKTNFDQKLIRAGGYFVISANPLFSPDIALSSLTLTESNTLRLRDSTGVDADQVQWGSVPAGQSYQRTASGVWIIATPTPGAENASVEGSSSGGSSATASTLSSPAPSATLGSVAVPVEPQIVARAGDRKRTAIVGAPLLFSGSVFGLKNEPIENARLLWNFGDGATAEGKSVAHTYRHPGTYISVLNAASGFYSASAYIEVEAIHPEVFVSAAGREPSSFVELENGSPRTLDLSGWILRGGGSSFTFPENTFLAAQARLRFSSEVTGIAVSSRLEAELFYPNGTPVPRTAMPVEANKNKTASPRQTETVSAPVKKKKTTAAVASATRAARTAAPDESMPESSGDVVRVLSFAGGPQTAEAAGVPAASAVPFFWWFLGALVFAAVGVAAALAVRNRAVASAAVSSVKEEAARYEIVEERGDEKIPF